MHQLTGRVLDPALLTTECEGAIVAKFAVSLLRRRVGLPLP